MIGRDKDADLGTSPVERVVHQLLRNLGELLPETVADVAASEKLVTGGPEELPPGLRDAKSVLERKVNLSLPPLHNGCAGVDLDVLRGLQAAADGGLPEAHARLGFRGGRAGVVGGLARAARVHVAHQEDAMTRGGRRGEVEREHRVHHALGSEVQERAVRFGQ